jgi:SAM-dependent methyltransferase
MKDQYPTSFQSALTLATPANGASPYTPLSLRATFLKTLFAATLLLPLGAHAQPANSYAPNVGQAGKDVVWVPTPQTLVDKMLDLANVTPQDKLLDLGSGDGRTVITAAKRGLQAQGVEYDPQMADLARRNATQAGVADRATITTGDLFQTDLSQADVITMFLLPSINDRLRPHILNLKPGTRIVSNSFPMGDWQPDKTERVTEDCSAYCTALLWIVPAKVEGTWKLGDQELSLTQNFQVLSGTLGTASISDARLDGSQISFVVGGARYTGRVDGATMNGTLTGDAGGTWSASKS